MTRPAPLLCAFALLLMLSVGCGGDGDSSEILAPPQGTQMSVAADAPITVIGLTVNFTVSATNAQSLLQSVSIDYEDDGTWDATATYSGQSSISKTFSHVYGASGGFTVRAQVIDAAQIATTKTMSITISPIIATGVRVWYRESGGSAAGDLAVCYVDGPPATCDGCSMPVESPGPLRYHGSTDHGGLVGVTEYFSQDRFVSGTTDGRYSCRFTVTFYAGEAGSEVQFAQGTCGTTSNDPEYLNCLVSLVGVVP